MTTLTQNLLAFANGFTGRIPVWSVNGDEVGWMTAYNANQILLKKGFAGMKGAHLVTKDWFFNDVPITVTSENTQPANKDGAITISFTRDTNAISIAPTGGISVPLLIAGGLALYLLLDHNDGRRRR